jgi:DNA-binding MltR family transcriptional regulator
MADPAYLRAFKQYAREEPNITDLPALEREFYGESDRAVAVLQAAMVDQTLEAAIKRKLSPNLSGDFLKDLFEFEGVIGSFSNKITMGFALGVFGKKTFHDLNIIRALRNAFAHLRKPMRFSSPAVAGMCENLTIPDIAGISHAPHAFYELSADAHMAVDNTNPKTRYITACHSIAIGFIQFGDLPKDSEFTTAMLP